MKKVLIVANILYAHFKMIYLVYTLYSSYVIMYDLNVLYTYNKKNAISNQKHDYLGRESEWEKKG